MLKLERVHSQSRHSHDDPVPLLSVFLKIHTASINRAEYSVLVHVCLIESITEIMKFSK